jgi:hypothetical protein
MSPSTWQSVCAVASTSVSLNELDDQLERIPNLSEDERSAIWLYAWAARDSVTRVAHLSAAA